MQPPFKKLSKKKQARYDKAIDENIDMLLCKEGVVSAGVGRKLKNGKLTDEICVIVCVIQKKSNVAIKDFIDREIDGIPTDVVEVASGFDPLEECPVIPERPADTTKAATQCPEVLGHIIEDDLKDLPDEKYLESPHRAEQPKHPFEGPIYSRGEPDIATPPMAEMRVALPGSPSSSYTGPDRISSHKIYDPLKAGMAIHNCKTSVDDVGVLGAIVFDKNDPAKAYGLSVFHAIGNKWGAWEANPIMQPPHVGTEIGTLFKRDKDLDVALFELNRNRKIEAKVVGGKDEEDIQLEEPIHARIGMRVECLARSGLIKGTVADVWTSRIGSKSVKTVYIQFDAKQTDAGDSGSIWVESGSRRPIGLHRGLDYRMHDRFDFTVYARATCINCLIQQFHPIQFKQKEKDKLITKLSDGHFEVAKAPSGDYLAFCHQSGEQPFTVQKFNKNVKLLETVETGIAPKSAITTSCLGNDVYAAWASADQNKIQLGIFSESKSKIEKISTCSFKTRLRPALASRKKFLVMAFTHEGKVKIRYTKNGKDWTKVRFPNANSEFAPSMVKFGNKLIVYWVESQTHKIRTADLLYSSDGRGARLEAYNFFGVGNYQASNDLAATVGGGKVFIAFATLSNELRVIESSNGWGSWRIRHSDFNKLTGPPSIACINGKLQINRLGI